MDDREDFVQTKYGYCYFFIESDSYAIIYNLFVYPEYRNNGYAKELLIIAIWLIRKNHYYNKIKIEAKPKEENININRLINFYKKLGLDVISTEEVSDE